jgi:hypothetical protein
LRIRGFCLADHQAIVASRQKIKSHQEQGCRLSATLKAPAMSLRGFAAPFEASRGRTVKRNPSKTRGNPDMRDVQASVTMTAYLADQMRSLGQPDLARVYDLVASELLERCEKTVAASQSVENRLH